ncbi:endonuclease/exonuclease/phosphatase family protein [Marinomonas sp. 5E14-1]|uniref:endonuclease/exonuclease/phosphatase family protein n=1 Tax=Marinomonas sp. 5E14-1 TaxID=3153922 RepID=UPI003263DCFC
MRLLSWNIQSTKGCDGVFNRHRIIDVIRKFGELDVICLQEVSRNIQAYNDDDQKQLFEQAFAGYHSVWATGFSRPLGNGKSQEFGNLTLVKQGKLLDQRIHQLPVPCVLPALQIPRTLAETVILYKNTTINLLNTHLAYHSESESIQQIEHLTRLRDQILSHTEPSAIFKEPSATDKKPSTLKHNQDAYHLAKRGQHVLLCGDLNVDLNSAKYTKMTSEMAWLDTAEIALKNTHSSQRQPTCGVFDTDLWPDGAHVRDYFLCSSGLHDQIANIEVNTFTMASDHQPICITLKD